MDQGATWYGGGPRPRPHCARWGPSSPPKKGAQPPQFSAHVCCGQRAGWIKMPLGMEVGFGQGHIVLDGTQLPLKGAQPPTFRPIFSCGQTAGWIKMPLGTKVGLGPGNVVFHVDPAPPRLGAEPLNFRPMSVVAKRLDGSRCHLIRR